LDAQLASVNSWTSPASWARGAYTDAGWALTGNEDDPSARPLWVTGNGTVQGALQYLFQDTTVKNYLARDPAQDSLTYTWDSNLNAVYAMAALNDATNADLRPFKNSNAKLILWHGGNDAALSHKSTTAYYQGVANAVGGQAAADEFVRYYIAPGVNHCAGGRCRTAPLSSAVRCVGIRSTRDTRGRPTTLRRRRWRPTTPVRLPDRGTRLMSISSGAP